MSVSDLEIHVPQEVVMRQLHDNSIVINLKNEIAYKLDETGTSIWLALQAHNRVADALAHLTDEYDISEEAIVKDVAELINKLVSAGLISTNSVK